MGGPYNPEGNKDIAEAGKATRFGQPGGPDPKAAREKQVNPASIRMGIKRLMAREIDPDKDIASQMTPEVRLRYLAGPQGKVTEAMIMSIAAVKQAGDNFKAMANIIDQVDGKLVEKKVEAQMTLEELVTGKFDDENQS